MLLLQCVHFSLEHGVQQQCRLPCWVSSSPPLHTPTSSSSMHASDGQLACFLGACLAKWPKLLPIGIGNCALAFVGATDRLFGGREGERADGSSQQWCYQHLSAALFSSSLSSRLLTLSSYSDISFSLTQSSPIVETHFAWV